MEYCPHGKEKENCLDCIRHKILYAQRECAYCNEVFETAQELTNHLLDKHHIE